MSITPLFLIGADIFKIINKMEIPYIQYYFTSWISYFYLGLIYRSKEIKTTKRKVYFSSTIQLVLIVIISIINNILFFKINLSYNFVTTQVKLLSCIYSFNTILLIMELNNLKLNPPNVLIRIGNVSYGMYYIHMGVLTVTRHFLNMINLNYYLYLIILVIIIVILSYFTIIIFKKVTKNKFDRLLGF